MFDKRRYFTALGLSLILVFAFHTIKYSTQYVQANLIQEHAEEILFDGTVMPLPATVSWHELPDSYFDSRFSEVPDKYKSAMPEYNSAELAKPFSSVDYSSPLRSAKITYSTPYMGNYKLDGVEGAGSHVAVDIKALKGTPVVSIANGIVTKVRNLDSGFGNHLVVMHPNVPLENGTVTTLYSSYSHMDKVYVKEGEKVMKGVEIGTVGATGFATTDHVHFQIDTADAPFYPYWPFSGAEQREAGYDFTGAINSGLGKENGYKYTIHPFNWVQKWLSEAPAVVSKDSDSETAEAIVARQETPSTDNRTDLATLTRRPTTPIVTDFSVDPVDVEESGVILIPTEKINIDKFPESVEELKLKIIMDKYLVVDKESVLRLELLDNNGNDYPFGLRLSQDPLKITAGKLHFPEGSLRASNFVNGVSEVKFIPKRIGKYDLEVENNTFKAVLEDIEVREFVDIALNDPDYLLLSELKSEAVIEGYADGTFRPEQNVTRAEAIKLILKSGDIAVDTDGLRFAFSDVTSEMWFYPFIKEAFDRKIVEGDPDGSLRPLSDITLAEHLKMLFSSVDADVRPVSPGEDWYQPYLDLALSEELITKDEYNNPGKELTRLEVAALISRFR